MWLLREGTHTSVFSKMLHAAPGCADIPIFPLSS